MTETSMQSDRVQAEFAAVTIAAGQFPLAVHRAVGHH
jgi:hypothetical protein